MKTRCIGRHLALLVSIIMLITSTVQTTFGYIVTKTDPLVNTFSPFQHIVSDLLIGKSVEHPFGEGYVIPSDIAFDFEVDLGKAYAGATIATADGDKTADENGVISLSVKPGQPVGLEGIAAGTVVKVTEVQNAAGFAAKDGAVTKEVTVDADGYVTVDFVNVYTPAPAEERLTVTGQKILQGRDWQEGDRFSFLLEQADGNGGWASVGQKTVTFDKDNKQFDRFDFTDMMQALVFDKAGSYVFRLSEVAGDLAHVDYDETVNYFTVTVGDADMDGKLEIQNVSGIGNTTVTKTDAGFGVHVVFNNTYVQPTAITLPITVTKTVKNNGTAVISPEGFAFVLENTATGERIVSKSNAEGLAVFERTYTAADSGKTYTYQLTEQNDGREGVTYDTTAYAITVTIALNEAGQPVATVTCNGEPVTECAVRFENIYDSAKVTDPPTGEGRISWFWPIMMLISGTMLVTILVVDKKKKA